ncbi:hypothetical protein EU546_02630 [Candidatus Thorarchaeota archaeon]|nr:MAG: hypothetical protein EU546_02630 [Candidatus Thorarchaeota archaeon]
MTQEPARLTYATVVHPNAYSEKNASLLIKSIREFAGRLSSSRIITMIPFGGAEEPVQTKERLEMLGADAFYCELEPVELSFPFVAEARCASQLEKIIGGNSEILAWLLANTIVLNEPSDFILRKGKELAYRPVHHKLLGLAMDEELNPFWTAVFRVCEVKEEDLFTMVPHVERREIRPYFNAGILVTRPALGLLSLWDDLFESVYMKPDFMRFYEVDHRYRIFIHQAILTGVILKMMKRDDMLELPSTYNYPVHLHYDDETPERPHLIDDLTTVRHEGFHKNPDWSSSLPAGNELKQWIKDALREP